MKKLLLSIIVPAWCIVPSLAQTEASKNSGATKLLVSGHAEISAVLDSGNANFGDAGFSAIFLYSLSDKLFLESEIEVAPSDEEAGFALEHANLVWMLGDNIAFHAGRFVPHFGLFRGRLGEGFMNRFPTNPVGFGDGGIGAMVETGFGFQGGFACGVSKMNYDLWVSNGPKLLTDLENAGQFEYEAYSDNNKNKAIGGRIGFLPLSNSSLELGLSYETAKTGDQYSEFQDKAVRMMAVDVNYVQPVSALSSTIRITGEYKSQEVDHIDFAIPDDTTGATYTFENKSNTFYGMFSIRPTGSHNKILRNLELAFRYSKFTTPDGAAWSYYDKDGKNAPLTQTSIGLDYWLKWNCVAKVSYQKQDGATDQVYLQLYYGF
ncbi:MAG: hypothetical protein NT126_04270 [Bacteroidetes bacterium]|nr:hypothetical protein [Bacteroidota bacterium]